MSAKPPIRSKLKTEPQGSEGKTSRSADARQALLVRIQGETFACILPPAGVPACELNIFRLCNPDGGGILYL